MKILLDISHPAQAHALHHFILKMHEKGHQTLIFARDKEITHELLNSWNISFINKGKGSRSSFNKLINTIKTVRKMYLLSRQFHPDLIISYSSYQAAITGWLLHKPVITFEDTEHVPLLHSINKFFSTKMITPDCYMGDFGKKHIRFNSYKELAYLHPNIFKPDINIQPEKPYFILRFVSWEAWHDRGHKGISENMKRKLINSLSDFGQLFISSETPLPEKWKKYQLPVPVQDFHSFLSGASLFFGESASIAAEAAVLGIPSIYIGNTNLGYINELKNKYHLIHQFGESDKDIESALSQAIHLLNQPNVKEIWQQKRKRILSEKIDLCEWMVDFVEKEVRGKG